MVLNILRCYRLTAFGQMMFNYFHHLRSEWLLLLQLLLLTVFLPLLYLAPPTRTRVRTSVRLTASVPFSRTSCAHAVSDAH